MIVNAREVFSKGFVENLRNPKKGFEFVTILETFFGFRTMYETFLGFRTVYETLF